MPVSRLSAPWHVASAMLVAALVLAACGIPVPPPIIQTVVVTSVVRETRIVAQTQIVNQTQLVEITATPAPAVGPILNPNVAGEIELWHFWASPARRSALRRVISYCQSQLPNLTVTETVKPFDSLWTANRAAVTAGEGMPAVIVSDRPALPQDAADGVYMNLQAWADRDNVTGDQFYDWAWDQTLYDGDTYGLPHETDVRVLFYNKTLFAAAGLDPDDPPETWAELETAADALDMRNRDGSFDRIGFFPLWSGLGADFYQYVMDDAEMLDPDGTVRINNPRMVASVEWIKAWVDRYGGWNAVREFEAAHNLAAPDDSFMNSRLAMRLDLFGYNSLLEFYRPFTDVELDDEATPDVRTEWGVARVPGPNGPGGTVSGGFSMSIPTGAPEAEAGWEFIKCATGAEGQASWARDTQAQPTNIRAVNDPFLAGSPSWAVVDEALSASTGGIFLLDYPTWTEQLTQRWEPIWTGELSAREALDQAQASVVEQIGP